MEIIGVPATDALVLDEQKRATKNDLELTKLAHDVARASLQGFFSTGDDGFANMDQHLRKQAVKKVYQILKIRLNCNATR